MMNLYECVDILWDYMNISHPLEKADVIIGFGSYDTDTAHRSAALLRDGWAPVLLFSGGLGKGTDGVFPKREAELYADIAVQEGIARERILIEADSTNSGDNVRFSRRLLEDQGIAVRTLIAVHKPYMNRRVYATIQKQWEGVSVIIPPNAIDFAMHRERYLRQGGTEDEIINSLVGDVRRMETYAALGYQIPQEVPADVKAACKDLLRAGYTKYV